MVWRNLIPEWHVFLDEHYESLFERGEKGQARIEVMDGDDQDAGGDRPVG